MRLLPPRGSRDVSYNAPMTERSFPSWLEPMAATLTREHVTGPDWVFERKLDGIRVLAFKRGADVRLLSRNQLPQNAHYPDVVRALERLGPSELILDGEATGVWGKADRAAYHVFDLLWLEGRSLTALPLEERRARLSELALAPPLELVARIDDPAPWERACREGWEGVIAKRVGSVYEHRRSPHWLKLKCEAAQELVIGGFTEPKGQRKGLGALLVGYHEADALVFAGKVGTGFDTAQLLQLRAELEQLVVPEAPFARAKDLPRLGVHWVRPELVVQVAFLEWTVHGKLRHPRLVGMRRDKRARDVVREHA